MRKVGGRAGIVVGVLLAWCACAAALDSSLDISQYAHTSWKVRDGFFKASIQPIAQTSDGYLWLGTQFGLLRFDGVRAVPWHPPEGQALPSEFVFSLLASRDGTLWIGTREGLASWREGKLTQYPVLASQTVYSLVEDHDSTIWAATVVIGSSPERSRLCSVQRGNVQCYGEEVFESAISWVYEDSRRNLWVGGMGGLWRWKPGPVQHYAIGRVYQAVEGEDGSLLLGTADGLRVMADGRAEGPPANYAFESRITRFLRSRGGSLWVGTPDHGLIHIHGGSTDSFSKTDGLSGNFVGSLFQDREGNVWVGTDGGLDRFRDFAVPSISPDPASVAGTIWSVLAAKDGSIWLATIGGLSRLRDGAITVFRPTISQKGTLGSTTQSPSTKQFREISNSGLPDVAQSLFEDDAGQVWATTAKGIVRWNGDRFIRVADVPGAGVFAIAEDSHHTVWIGSSGQGLFGVPRQGPIVQIPWSDLGHGEYAISLAVDPSQGGLWIGFPRSGIAYWEDGKLRASYSTADGLGKGYVKHLRFGSRGALWAATDGGLSRIRDGRVETLTSKNGLPCDTVQWSMEDDDHAVWLFQACGLVRVDRDELDTWVNDPKHVLKTTLYDASDGVAGAVIVGGYKPRVSKAPDGRILFLGAGDVSVIDPHHLAFNKLPPPVHIEKIAADDKTYDATNGLRLPPHVRYLTIDYTALSLVAPEKVRFRYKLEGEDKDWREVVNKREVEYTNLGPKHYRFRVLACNNSGVWNEQGASLEFVIPPAWYQTRWFYALCAATFLLMLWGLYHLRVLQLQREFNAALEARVGERTRVARDLHDTLLQSFHGLLLRFGIVDRLLPARAEEAKKELQRAMELATAAITEGRDAVQGLRDSTIETNDLVAAIKTIGEELAVRETNHSSARFAVRVEGASRDLRPLLRDEVYRIAAECLRNAFRHANASRIEVEIRYGDKQFRLRVLDDGKGIDPTFLRSDGRQGHYGLRGMRERAQLVGGKLVVWSQLNAGTEVELTIPASNAYAAGPRTAWWSQWFSAKESDVEETKIES